MFPAVAELVAEHWACFEEIQQSDFFEVVVELLAED